MIAPRRAASFPSEAWFAALAAHTTEEPAVYRGLGFAEFRLIVEIVEPDGQVRAFGLILDGYEATSTGELTDPGAFGADAVITGPVGVWQDMIANIAEHGGADLRHTLNALSIADAPLRVVSRDPIGRDKFFRYAETLQTLFDASARFAPAVV